MRNPVFDIMKGIGILAMIIGHLGVPCIIEDFIFTWHMPLFFIISGYFFKDCSLTTLTKKCVRQLLLPYFITAIILILVTYAHSIFNLDATFHCLLSVFVGSGSKANPTFLGEYMIGAIWFLPAMFWCRWFFQLIISHFSYKYVVISTIVLSAVVVIIGQYIFIPFDVLQGMNALVFFCAGYHIRKQNILNKPLSVINILTIFLLTATSQYSGSLSIARNHYGCYPINVAGAIGMTLLIYKIAAKATQNLNRLSSGLAYLGRISLLVLCVHIIELDHDLLAFFLYKHISGLAADVTIFIYRVGIVLLISCLLARIRIVAKVFGLSQYR